MAACEAGLCGGRAPGAYKFWLGPREPQPSQALRACRGACPGGQLHPSPIPLTLSARCKLALASRLSVYTARHQSTGQMNVDEEDPVTNLKEAKILLDPPKCFSEGKRGHQINETAESMKNAIDEKYDYLLESKAGSKRKRESAPEAAAKAAAKKEDAENKLAGMDWHAMLAGGTLKKATVPQLKAYCATHGLKGTGKKVCLLRRLVCVRVCVCVGVFVGGWAGGCGWAFTCVLDLVRICVLHVDVCVFCMLAHGFSNVALRTWCVPSFHKGHRAMLVGQLPRCWWANCLGVGGPIASVQRHLAWSLENG